MPRESRSGDPAPAVHRPLFPRGTAAATRPCDAPCAERDRPFVLAATILGSAMAFIDGTVISIALPRIQADFGATFAQMQWVHNVYTLCMGALILIGGTLGDRIRRRRVFMVGIAVFALASLGCAAAPSVEALIAARLLQGMGAAMLVPQSLAIIAAAFPKEVRGRATGIWAGFAALTTAGGPMLGGVFVDLLSWRAVFWINLPIAAVTLVLAATRIPESRNPNSTGRLDWRGALLVGSGFGVLTWSLIAAAERGLGDPALLASFALAFGLLTVFWLAEARHAHPMMPPAIFARPGFSAANLLTVFLYFALSAVLLLLPFELMQVRGYSGTQAGASLLPFGLTMGLFSGRAGALADRFGPWPPLATGASLVAGACIWFALMPAAGPYWTTVFGPVMVLAVGMTIAVTPLTTAVMNAVSEAEAGTASGINNAASRLAGLIAVAVVGAVAVAVFGAELAAMPEVAGLPDAARAALLAEADRLAAIEVPAAVRSAVPNIANLIHAAFRDAFAVAMAISATCAGAAAVVAVAKSLSPSTAGRPAA